MVGDGRRYSGLHEIPPMHYHPGAPVTASLFNAVLSACYYACQNENQILYQLYKPLENANRLVDFPGSEGYPKNFDAIYSGGTHQKIANGYTFFPEFATHLYGLALIELYSVPFAAENNQTAWFRFTGSQGSSSDFTISSNAKQQFIYGASRFNNPESVNLQVINMRCEIGECVNVDSGDWLDVEAYSRGLMIPHLICAWWEAEE